MVYVIVMMIVVAMIAIIVVVKANEDAIEGVIPNTPTIIYPKQIIPTIVYPRLQPTIIPAKKVISFEKQEVIQQPIIIYPKPTLSMLYDNIFDDEYFYPLSEKKTFDCRTRTTQYDGHKGEKRNWKQFRKEQYHIKTA